MAQTKLPNACKKEVYRFLSDYDASYFYEVVPIVDNGGFASLKKLKKSKRNIIPDSEIDRLSKLSNLGLGKFRAKVGGELIKDKFGDNG